MEAAEGRDVHDERAGEVERLLRIGRETAALLPESARPQDHGDLLHDETGPPHGTVVLE